MLSPAFLLQVDAFDGRHIGGIGQIGRNRIEDRLDSYAVECRTAQHRLNLQMQRGVAQHLAE